MYKEIRKEEHDLEIVGVLAMSPTAVVKESSVEILH